MKRREPAHRVWPRSEEEAQPLFQANGWKLGRTGEGWLGYTAPWDRETVYEWRQAVYVLTWSRHMGEQRAPTVEELDAWRALGRPFAPVAPEPALSGEAGLALEGVSHALGALDGLLGTHPDPALLDVHRKALAAGRAALPVLARLLGSTQDKPGHECPAMSDGRPCVPVQEHTEGVDGSVLAPEDCQWCGQEVEAPEPLPPIGGALMLPKLEPGTGWPSGAALRARWHETDEERYSYCLNVLPPIYFAGGFFVSEPADHDERGVPIYAALVKEGPRYFIREVARDKHAEALRELRSELHGS